MTAAIVFNGVNKTFKTGFKRAKVLFDVSFEVAGNEIFGFLGPNGAGKSTSIKLMLNFIKPDAGHIAINGRNVRKDHFQRYIGYLPEMPCFMENLTGNETLEFAGKACGMHGADIKSRCAEVLERLNLAHAGNAPIRTYSKGMKQRLGLAVALIHDPQIYILDEPMSGLDPMGRRLITDVILELGQRGKTVFFSSHILSDIERLCSRIGILNKGRLLFCGHVNDITQAGETMEDAFIRIIDQDKEAQDA